MNPPGEWPLVGRTEEVARLQASLTAGAGGGVLVAGPPGAGKTSLARRAVEITVELGLTPRWVYGTKATASIPLGPFAPALPAMVAAPTPDRLLYEAHRALREQDGGVPALLAVDDAHLLDEMSALLVYQLVTAGTTLVVLTIRSEQAAPEPILDLWKDAHVERVELGPLGQDHIEEILTTVLAGPVDMALAYQLWRRSGGNPLYIRELFVAAWDKQLLRQDNGTWRLTGELPSSPRLIELVKSRLGELDDKTRAALELLAIGEPLRLDHVDGLVDFDLLSTMEEDGLVRVEPTPGGELLRLGHPLYGEALRSAVPPLRARHLHRTLADAVEAGGASSDADRDQIVRWRLASGAPLASDELLSTARRALIGFDTDLAIRCASEAYQGEPSARTGVVLGRALVMARQRHEAEALLASVDKLTSTDDEVVEAAKVRADNLYHWLDRPADALAVVDRAEARVTSEDARRRLAFDRGWFELFEGRPLKALTVAEAHLSHPDAGVQLDAAVLGGRAAMQAGRYNAGREFAGRIAAAQRLLGPGAAEPDLRLTVEVYIDIQVGRLSEAERTAQEAHARALARGDLHGRGWFAELLGRIYLDQGRLVTSERWLREAIVAMSTGGVDPRARLVVTEVALVQALRGDARGAAATLADVERYVGRAWPLFESFVARTRAWTAVAGEDTAAARSILAEAAEEERRRESYTAEVVLVHDLVRLGGAVPAVVERLETLADLVEGELAAARAAHGRAVLDGDREALIEVGARFERMSAHLLAAETFFAAADLAADAGADREAAAAARSAHELLARCEEARVPAPAAGASPAPQLTARELEIAERAAAGLSSKAIAAELFLSARTVDNYLGRIFAKLGITSRAELAGALGGGPGLDPS